MKYTVHMVVDARIDVEVDANDPDDAYKKALTAYCTVSMDDLEVIDARPVRCEDGTGVIVKEY